MLAYYECHSHVSGIVENACFSFSLLYGISSLNAKKKHELASFCERIRSHLSDCIYHFFLVFFYFFFNFFPCQSVQSLKFSLKRSGIAITLRKSYGSCLSCVRPNRSTTCITSNIADDDKRVFLKKRRQHFIATPSRF